MKRVLLIAYSYPPLQNPQAIRWFYLSNLLAENGYLVDVLTLKVKLRENNRFKLHKNVNVKRISPGFFEERLNRKKFAVKKDLRQSKFKLAFYRMLLGFIETLLLGSIKWEWFVNVIRTLFKTELDLYSAVIVSQEPFISSSLPVVFLRKRFKGKVIVDVGDPAIAGYYSGLRIWQWLHNLLERRVFKLADAVLLTGEGPKKFYSELYPDLDGKFFIVRQGFKLNGCLESKKKRNDKFTIAYTGTFYRGFRSPDVLVKALLQLDFDFRFLVAGWCSEFLDLFCELGDKVVVLGELDHFEVLELQREADLLIHLGNNQISQVPGKFYEYLGSGTPILSIYQTDDDETAVLTTQLGCGIACKNSVLDIKAAVETIHDLWSHSKLKEVFNLNCREFKEFSWEHSAKKIVHLLNSC